MAPKLYYFNMSPPARCVLLTAKALDLELDLEEVTKDYMKTPEMLQINPQHTIPTLVDEDFIIWDSHVVAGYLISQYGGEDNSLYPTDPKKRALVDQRLHFDTGNLFPNLPNIMKAIFGGATEVPEEIKTNVMEMYGILEIFLDDKQWLAGEEMTLADLSIVSTLSTLDLMIPVIEEEFPKLYNWFQQMKELPYYEEANQEGLDKVSVMIHSRLG